MKLFLLFFFVFALVSGKELKKTATTAASKRITDNLHSNEPITAITYGTAQTGTFLSNKPAIFSGYKTPIMVSQLPDLVAPPTPGPLVSVQEIPSQTTYYDGSLNLNAGVIDCRTFALPGDCVKQSFCGWCGQRNSCIRGTVTMPGEDCLAKTYVFSAPYPNWNPLIAQT